MAVVAAIVVGNEENFDKIVRISCLRAFKTAPTTFHQENGAASQVGFTSFFINFSH